MVAEKTKENERIIVFLNLCLLLLLISDGQKQKQEISQLLVTELRLTCVCFFLFSVMSFSLSKLEDRVELSGFLRLC